MREKHTTAQRLKTGADEPKPLATPPARSSFSPYRFSSAILYSDDEPD